jgi:carbon storage regulator
MLVLSCKVSERIYIGDDIVITVVQIDRGKVRLGIEAPKGVPIHREEIHLAIQGDLARLEGEGGIAT